MNKNLLAQNILIIAVLIVFLFGIFGIPSSFTARACWQSLQKRIHLGLDLKGGTHLILQVQVNDAINADTDRAVERLKDALKSANIAFGEISKPDPQNHPEVIQIKGVPPESSSELRRIVTDKLPRLRSASGARERLDADHEALGGQLTPGRKRCSRRSRPSATELTSSASPSR